MRNAVQAAPWPDPVALLTRVAALIADWETRPGDGAILAALLDLAAQLARADWYLSQVAEREYLAYRRGVLAGLRQTGGRHRAPRQRPPWLRAVGGGAA